MDTLGSLGTLGDLVAFQLVHHALIGYEQQVVVRRTYVHFLYKVVLALLHAGDTSAAAVLSLVGRNGHTLDVAAVGVGDYVFLYGDKILHVHLAADVFDAGAALIAELILYLLHLFDHYLQDTAVVGKDILEICDALSQLVQFVEDLLLLETGESCQGHVCDVVSLNVGKTEAVTEALLSLGNVLGGLHDVDDLVDVIEGDLQAL